MSELVFAISVRSRLVGLLPSRVCARGEILVLVPCNSIHTFCMRDRLDVAFIDVRGRVLSAYRAVAPFRMLKERHAALVLERRACLSELWFEPGQILTLTASNAIFAKIHNSELPTV